MPGRILVVDDILPNVTLLEAKLTNEYYDIITADDGLKAIELAQSQAPDLILLDVMMPGLDGFQVCEKLKNDPATAHIPVVMVTALSDAADRVRGLMVGADDFLSKPVRDIPLFARVRSLVRLKLLMDVWRIREATSNRLGYLNDIPLPGDESVTHGRVLVIDDNTIDIGTLETALTVDDHELVMSQSIQAATPLIDNGAFDLLVISLHLQGQDVLRFCSQVRSNVNEAIRGMPILLLAEDDDDLSLIAKGLDLGVNDYLTRPIDRNELVARVRTQIRRRRYQERLRNNYERSIARASTDALTGVYNRHYLDAHLDQLLSRAHADKKQLAIAFCDIDHFKRLNDTYGHDAGDAALIEFTQRLQRNLRSFDLVARMGGEEFLVVMPDTPLERAYRISERMRSRIEETPFKLPSGEEVPVTISVGIAISHELDDLAADMVKRADTAMYQAKRTGRNRVVVAPDPAG
jgi:two-component system cell cycle response regulator